MWNRLSQAAGLGTGASDSESTVVVSEMEEQIVQQDSEIQNLKVIVRENEKLLQEKNKELEDTKSKFQKFKLQSKAKICQLNNQLKELEKSTKKDDGDFEDTSSSDSSDQSNRGKVIVLKKQLEQARQQVDEKEREIKEINKNFEAVIKDLQAQLDERGKQILSLKKDTSLNSSGEQKDNPQDTTSVHEMYAQVVYKDSKIIELNNQILKHEREILDLQEHIKEKDEVLQSRNRAIQLMTADMSRKGKSVVDELDEVRQHMRNMQENFTITEVEWKAEKDRLNQEIKEMKEKFEKDINEREMKIKNSEETIRKLEVTRHDLATKNAELQTKLVVVQENADKHYENFRKQLQEELNSLRRNIEQEKSHSIELQKALNEATNQSEAKVLKARVKERTKFKALERELKALKEIAGQTPDEVTHLHHCIAELEEEKGSLQLKLLEVEEQIALQEQVKTDKDTQSCLKETEEKYVQVEMIPSQQYHKGDSDLKSPFSGVQLHHEQTFIKSSPRECDDEEDEHHSEIITILKEENISSETDVPDPNKLQEDNENSKQELLHQIHKLQDLLIGEKHPVVGLAKESDMPDEKILQLDEFQDTEIQDMQNVIFYQSDDFHKELKKLQDKCCNIIEENRKFKFENKLLKNALEGKEILTELGEEKQWFSVNSPDVLETTSLIENHSSQQVLLHELFSLCMVRDLPELREKCMDMIDNIKNLNSSISEKDTMLGNYKQQHEKLVDEVGKLQLACQTANNELKKYSELIHNLKEHISAQEKTYKDQISELNQIIEDQKKEKSDLINVASDRKKLLEKATVDIEEKQELIRNLTENVKQQSNVICQLEKQTEFLSGEIEVLKETKKSDGEKVHSKMSSLLEQISDLEAEVSKLQAEISSKQQMCDDLKNKSNYFEELYEDLLKDQQARNTVYRDYEHKVESLQQQVLLLQNEFNKKNQGIESVQKALKNKYETEKDMLKTHQDSIDSLEIVLNECQAEKEKLHEVNISRESEIKQLHSSLKELNSKLDSEIEKSVNIYHEYQCANEEKKALSNELLDVQNQVQSLKTEASSLCMSLAEQEDVNKNLQSDNMKLEAQVSNLKSENEKLLRVSDEEKLKSTLLKKQNNDISSQLELAKNDLIAVRSNLNDMVLKNKTLKQTLVKCSKDLEMAAREAKTLKEKSLSLSDKHSIESPGSVALTKGGKEESDKTNEKDSMSQHKLKNLEENSQQMGGEDDMAENVVDLQTVSHVVEEAELSLRKNECLIDSLPEESKISVRIETEALSDNYATNLNNLLSQIDSFQHQLLCAKATIDEYRSKLESETQTRLCLQEKISQYEASRKHLKTILLSTFQENMNMKADLSNLKSDTQIKLNQYSLDLIHLRNELVFVTDNFSQKEDELATLLKNSISENTAHVETKCDLSEKLEKSCVLVQNLTEEKDKLQKAKMQLEQQVDDLTRKLLTQEGQYQLLMGEKHEYEKQLSIVQKDIEHLTLFKTQYVFIVGLLLDFRKHVIEEIEESTVNEWPELEFPKDFHVLEDIVMSLENKYLDCKHQTSRLSSDLNKLGNEKESLVKSIQAVQDENSTLLQKISYLEDVKDTLVSIFPVLSKKVSDIAEMSSVSLGTVLGSINSRDVVLQKMEASVTLLKKSFLVLKKRLEILQSENVSMRDQIDCNSQEILHLQNVNNDLLKKSRTETQVEKHKVSKQLSEHAELLQALKNWISQQGIKIRHLTDFLQMFPTKNVSLLDKMNVENSELQNEECSDVKAENLVSVKAVKLEKPAVDYIFCHSTECKEESESNKNQLFLIEKKIQELVNSADLKDTTENELLEEHETNKDVLPNLILVLKDSEISLSKLHSQVKDIANENSSYKHDLEFCIQAKNSLQTEVKNVHSSLSTLENEKIALKQELEGLMHQLQYTKMDRKEKINVLQTEVENYVQINKELNETIEVKNLHLTDKQVKYDELMQQHISESEKYNLIQKDLNSLKLELERKCKSQQCSNCKESVDGLKQTMEDTLKRNLEMKNHLKSICDMLLDKSYSSDLFFELDHPSKIDYSTDDDYMEQIVLFLKDNICMLMKTLDKKQCELQKTVSDLETVKLEKENILKTLNDKTHLCEGLYAQVEELKKSLPEFQARLELNDYKVETKGDKTGEYVVQAPNIEAEDQIITEKLQEGATEKLCCKFEGCQIANESLHHQLSIQKMKYDKMLTKLKVSRDQVEELHAVVQKLKLENEKLSASHDELLILHEKQLKSNQKLQADWKATEEEKDCEICRLQNLTSELKERVSFEGSLGTQLRTELQQYKDLWEQSNSTFELQKEENEQLQLKVKKLSDDLENVSLKMSELHNKCIASDAEKKYLEHIIEGLKENVNMLIADNDTFQELTEKLSQSKAALEKDIAKLKENNPREMNELNEKIQSEMNGLKNKLQATEEQKNELSDIMEEYKQLKSKYFSLEETKNCLESRIQVILKDKEVLENQNKNLYSELRRQTDEFHHLKRICVAGSNVSIHDKELYRKNQVEDKRVQFEEGNVLQYNSSSCETPMPKGQNQKLTSQHLIDDQNSSSIHATSEKPYLEGYSKHQIEELVKEKQALELHIKYLTDELQLAMIKKETVVEECLSREKEWKNESTRRESQFQQQIASLQMQLLATTSHADGGGGVMQEHINKVSALESELQHAIRNLHQQTQRCEELNLEVSKLLEERNSLRLKLTQYQQHSRGTQPNSGSVSGDNTASNEKLPSDEFRLLLVDDDDEHEVFPDTDFSITRHVKSSTQKFERWIRRRRNHLCRVVRSKNYYQFLYLVYLFAMHIWIIICTFGHS